MGRRRDNAADAGFSAPAPGPYDLDSHGLKRLTVSDLQSSEKACETARGRGKKADRSAEDPWELAEALFGQGWERPPISAGRRSVATGGFQA